MNKFYKSILEERIAQYGTETILNEEVISLLTGISVIEIKNAIETFGMKELIKFSGNIKFSKTQKRKLELLYMFNKRLNDASYKTRPTLDSSSKAGEYFVNLLKFYDIEVFYLAFLDSQNRLINCVKVSAGTLNEAPVYPREVVKLAIYNNANAVILAHVHPGGSLSASRPDIEVTEKLTKALETIAVKVIDHIIVGEGNYVSMAEKGLMCR